MHLAVDLAWIVVMKAANGKAVIQQHPPVGHVDRVHCDGHQFAEALAHRHIKRSVFRQVSIGIAAKRKQGRDQRKAEQDQQGSGNDAPHPSSVTEPDSG